MTLPRQADIEIPLLEEIEKAGGSARPRDLYPRVTSYFPDITAEDLRRILPAGNPQWTNRIQWVRMKLVSNGEIDASTRGVWSITARGRQRLRASRDGMLYVPRQGRKKKVMSRGTVAPVKVDHDLVARALEKIGRAFGFETLWKPKVNDLRPDRRAFKSKRKTLDVAWGIANLTWVAIEVQVGGSVPDLIYRFQQVHQWSLRLVVVAVPSSQDEILETIRDYPFRDKVILLSPDEVTAATRSLDRLLDLRAKVFEEPSEA